jgi:hypothetical protein
MTPRDIPITREMVYNWIEDWKAAGDTRLVGEYITEKINELNLPDPMVNISGHDIAGDEMPIAEFILQDLPSYANATSR